MPELAPKPQALRQVADELVRDLGEPFVTLWARLVEERGPKQAARVFAHVLCALETYGHPTVIERVQRAMTTGEHVLLAVAPPPEPVPLLDALPASLAGIDVVSGTAAEYDALLRGVA